MVFFPSGKYHTLKFDKNEGGECQEINDVPGKTGDWFDPFNNQNVYSLDDFLLNFTFNRELQKMMMKMIISLFNNNLYNYTKISLSLYISKFCMCVYFLC